MKTNEKKMIMYIMSIISIITVGILLINYSERTVTNVMKLNEITHAKASNNSWTWGNASAVLDANGTLTISGQGTMRR